MHRLVHLSVLSIKKNARNRFLDLNATRYQWWAHHTVTGTIAHQREWAIFCWCWMCWIQTYCVCVCHMTLPYFDNYVLDEYEGDHPVARHVLYRPTRDSEREEFGLDWSMCMYNAFNVDLKSAANRLIDPIRTEYTRPFWLLVGYSVWLHSPMWGDSLVEDRKRNRQTFLL